MHLLSFVVAGKKINQTCRTGECITVINCGVKKVRDILDTEEIRWKVVLSLCGVELQRALFAGWKLIIGFCLKLSLCKRHVSVFQTLPPQLFASLFVRGAGNDLPSDSSGQLSGAGLLRPLMFSFRGVLVLDKNFS